MSEQRLSEQRLTITWREGRQISAALVTTTPAGPGIVLAHGAGGNLDTPFLANLAEQLAARGVGSLRFNFPYTENRRRMPDLAPTLEACYRAVANRASELFPRHLFLGGKSMGGRIASQIVAQGTGLPPIRGLVFLGYPLHPPGKPEKLRDKHLYGIPIPMLFIEGTKDAFADRTLLSGVLDRLPTARVHWIEGGDHSFKVTGRKPAAVNQEILEAVATFVAPAASVSPA